MRATTPHITLTLTPFFAVTSQMSGPPPATKEEYEARYKKYSKCQVVLRMQILLYWTDPEYSEDGKSMTKRLHVARTCYASHILTMDAFPGRLSELPLLPHHPERMDQLKALLELFPVDAPGEEYTVLKRLIQGHSALSALFADLYSTQYTTLPQLCRNVDVIKEKIQNEYKRREDKERDSTAETNAVKKMFSRGKQQMGQLFDTLWKHAVDPDNEVLHKTIRPSEDHFGAAFSIDLKMAGSNAEDLSSRQKQIKREYDIFKNCIGLTKEE